MIFKKQFREIFIRLCELEDQVYALTNRVDKLEDKKLKIRKGKK